MKKQQNSHFCIKLFAGFFCMIIGAILGFFIINHSPIVLMIGSFFAVLIFGIGVHFLIEGNKGFQKYFDDYVE